MDIEEAIKRCTEVFNTYDPKFVEKIVRTCEGHDVSFVNSFIYDMFPEKPEYTKGFWIGALRVLVGGDKPPENMFYCKKCEKDTPCHVVDGKIVCIVCEVRGINNARRRQETL